MDSETYTDERIKNEVAKMRRIVLSQSDLVEARKYTELLKSSEGDSRKALECALIVTYSRPFSGNGQLAPDLPARALKEFTAAEKVLHDQVICHRNRAMAHSDADLAMVQFSVVEFGGEKMAPFPFMIKYFPFLQQDDLPVLLSCIEKLLGYAENERQRIVCILPVGNYAQT